MHRLVNKQNFDNIKMYSTNVKFYLSFGNAQAIIVELVESKSKWPKNLRYKQGVNTFRKSLEATPKFKAQEE